jgi:cytochrome c-type biogenesis protein CcmE
VPVVYRGVVPDTFQESGEVVVEGGLGSEGVFRARTLLAKCPSKYEPEESKQT